jgi:hypothetical protein
MYQAKTAGSAAFEHHLCKAECLDEFCYNIRAPCADVFGDALGFDHDQVRAGIYKAAGLGFGIMCKNVFDKAACRYQHFVPMGEFNDFA